MGLGSRFEQRWESRRRDKREWEGRHLTLAPESRPDRPVEGAHTRRDSLGLSDRSRSWQARGRVVLSLVFVAQATWALTVGHHGYAARSALLLALVWLSEWRLSRCRTVVAPDALHIVGLLTRTVIPWNEITAVADRSAWSPTRTIIVTTTEGRDRRTDVSDTLRDEFVTFARAHGMSTEPGSAS
jgi:hypothetical protein